MSNDQNFKNLILDYPRDALELFVGAEAKSLDKGAKIIPIREEQLKNRLGDRFRELDVPLLVEWPDGTREAILFVVEEDTDPRRFSIHRLAHYCLDLSEMFKTNRVVPVVIFLYAGNYARELVLAGDEQNYLRFSFIECALKGLSYEQYRESSNIVARLNLPNMSYRPEQKVDVYADAVRGLRRLEPETEKRLKYLDFIDIYADLDDMEYKLYVYKYSEEAEVMSAFAERFREEGMQKGVQKGEAQLLIRQMSLKFGQIPEDKQRLVESADSESLIRWSERILTAQSLEEVLQ
ncbi:hypothetical protein [Desulfonatronospira sp.]|uniref:hypothetical protein n=1 Tax=Desulfonatronospira sp. TaxID=1962951 RepID=UPI0025BE7908|nr:hypothetical protein [Desulfonatronospira sp.]